MNIDQFLELARTRRSVRKFKSDTIPEGAVEKIIEAARWAMSGANAQPWEFIVVTDQETKDKIAAAHLATRTDQYMIELTRVEDLRHNLGRTVPAMSEFKDAPIVIVCLGDRRTIQASILSTGFIPSEGGSDAIYLKDMANAAHMMHLAAAACGLGSEHVSVSHTMEQLLKPVLNVPEIMDIHALVVIGYPARVPTVAVRRDIKELIHYGKYDKSRLRSCEDILNVIREWRRVGARPK